MNKFEAAYYLIKLIIFFSIFYIVIPSRIIKFDRAEDKLLDKIFISFIHMVFVTIILVHSLVLIKLYETISLLLCYLVILYCIVQFRDKNNTLVSNSAVKIVVQLMQFSDERQSLVSDLYNKLSSKTVSCYSAIKKHLSLYLKNPIFYIVPLVILAAGFFIRVENSFNHASYVHIDSYLHMLWAKQLSINDLFFGGIYPRGLHSVSSALEKIFFIDQYWINRFVGVIYGIMLVLTIYYFTLRMTDSFSGAFIAISIAAMINHPDLPGNMFRQTATLTQEFSMVFVLPGVYFLILFLRKQSRRYLFLYLECLIIMLLSHTFVAIVFVIWTILILFISLFLLRSSLKSYIKFGVLGIVSAAISYLPYQVGFWIGGSYHQSSVEMLNISFSFSELINNFFNNYSILFINPGVFLNLIIPLTAIMIVGIFFLKDNVFIFKTIIFLSLTWIMFLLYKIPEFFPGKQLPELLDKVRIGSLFWLLLPGFLAMGFTLLGQLSNFLLKDRLFFFKRYVIAGIPLLIILLLIQFYPIQKLYRGVYEYDAAAEQYLKIRKEFERFNWMIVGPHEQYDQVVGWGFHYQLYDFIKDFKEDQLAKKEFEFPFSTSHIFFYTEKIPLYYEKPITLEDAKRSIQDNPGDPYFYYYRTEARAVVEARAIQLLQSYQNTHGDLKVYYEDENIKIYYLYHKNADKYYGK